MWEDLEVLNRSTFWWKVIRRAVGRCTCIHLGTWVDKSHLPDFLPREPGQGSLASQGERAVLSISNSDKEAGERKGVLPSIGPQGSGQRAGARGLVWPKLSSYWKYCLQSPGQAGREGGASCILGMRPLDDLLAAAAWFLS